MAFDAQKSAAVAAVAKAKASAQAAALKMQDAEDAQSQAVADATAAQSAVFAIQPDPVLPPVVVPPVITVTPDGYASSVTDKNGVVWTIVNGQIAINGTVNGATSTVSKLYAKAGVCYFVNASGVWYIPNPAGGPSTQTSDPTAPVVVPPTGGGSAQTGWTDTAPLGYSGTAKLLTSWTAASGALPANASPNRSRGGPKDTGVSGPFNGPTSDGGGENACFAPSQVRIQNGELILSAAKNTSGGNLGYQSGCVNWFDIPWGDNTALEAMVWMADGVGLWPALWGWGNRNWSGPYRELDVIEKWENGDYTDNYHKSPNYGNYPGHPAGWGPADVGNRWVRVLFTMKGGKMSPYADGKLYTEGVMNETPDLTYDLAFNLAILNSRTPVLGDGAKLGYWKLWQI